jgi:NADPH-dependent 2,4-dienoyl-CoA reductase/sulfur reductase-like enzyme
MHPAIIGGSDAGISAALWAKECNPSVEVTVLVADSFLNFSICGLPFLLSGEVPDWRPLAHRTIEEIGGEGIHLPLNQRTTSVDPVGRTVTATGENKQSRRKERGRGRTLPQYCNFLTVLASLLSSKHLCSPP